jgi:hypothetical protein
MTSDHRHGGPTEILDLHIVTSVLLFNSIDPAPVRDQSSPGRMVAAAPPRVVFRSVERGRRSGGRQVTEAIGRHRLPFPPQSR